MGRYTGRERRQRTLYRLAVAACVIILALCIAAGALGVIAL